MATPATLLHLENVGTWRRRESQQ